MSQNSSGVVLLDDPHIATLRKRFLLEETIPFSPLALFTKAFALWFYLIQVSETDVPGIGERTKHHVLVRPEFADARDACGRAASSVATPSNQRAVNSVLLIHGRYRLRVSTPAHQSATCFVFEAIDEGCVSEQGDPLPATPVALKFMLVKAQFVREVDARLMGFDPALVIDIIRTHPDIRELGVLDGYADRIAITLPNGAVLNKQSAEKMFCLVLPLAEQNLFVVLKQERFAGIDLDSIRHVTKQIIVCVQNMHGKGVIHADIKPLNIMRRQGAWSLVDLDAVCRIGQDTVGLKSSSGYVPPEAVYVSSDDSLAMVRSEAVRNIVGEECELLITDPSFDIWSLGCILYQLINRDVLPLFQCGQDDNFSSDWSRPDNLFELAQWCDDFKESKLALIDDPLARNLVSSMLI